MAKIKEYRNLPLVDLTLAQGQVRTSQTGEGIDELAESIKTIGLLQPIIVCPSSIQKGKYEILSGQRRFMAVQLLKKETIAAMILDGPVDEVEAKVISVSENLMRRDLNSRDAIDACTYLYKKYSTARAVSEKTGLPYAMVCQYVKYDRLLPALKKIYDGGGYDLKTILKAQDAAEQMGGDKDTMVKAAITYAKEMSGMTPTQQKTLEKTAEASGAGATIEEIIEKAKQPAKTFKIIVVLGPVQHKALKEYADNEGASEEEVASSMIEDALKEKGFLGEEE